MNIRMAGISLAAAVAVSGLAACGSLAQQHQASSGSGGAVPAVQPTTPAAVPSPDAKYVGACDYTLGNDPVNGTAVATGDIEVTNDGNIGVAVTATITWPQQGYNPLTQSKTGVQVAAGQMVDVQFNMPLTQDQLSNLQDWQTGHMGESGCTYAVSMTSTFGSTQ